MPLLNGNKTFPPEYITNNSNSTHLKTIKAGLMAIGLFISTIQIHGSTGYGSNSFTSCIEYSKTGTLNSFELGTRVRAIEMITRKVGLASSISNHPKRVLSDKARQRILARSKAHQEKWDKYAQEEAARRKYTYYGSEE